MKYDPYQQTVRRFRLSEVFIDQYRHEEVPWGPVGYITYKRTYARRLDEFDPGTEGTEEWFQTCRRVIEGMFTIQKKHVASLGLEWNDTKAQKTAKEAYDRLFNLKWTPPGRGLWMMGTKFVEERTGAGLFNCSFRSTREIDTKGGYLFRWIMDALMLGVGVGFDTLGSRKLTVKQPEWIDEVHYVPDDREGWCESVQILLDGYFFGQRVPRFDYSKIREYGAPIKGFGGTSSGYKPLKQLHDDLKELYDERIGKEIRSTTIVDTENLIGKCVVAGNVRRSAALALGEYNDMDYLSMKNDEKKLYSHRWGSNNSFNAYVGMDYTWHSEQSQKNGEPGYIWLDNAKTRGRMKDGYRDDDINVAGFNPCVTVDTWIHTSTGPRQVRDMIQNVDFGKIIVDGKEYESTSNGFWKTGIKKVFEIETAEGHTLKLTDNHKLMTSKGWLPLSEISVDDKIVLNDHRGYQWKGEGIFGEGYLLGLLTGDGTFAKEQAILSVWHEDDESHTGIMTEVLNSIAPMKKRKDFKGWSHITSRNESRLRLGELNKLASSYNIDRTKRVTENIEQTSCEFYSGYLRGFFDADGSVQGTQANGVSIRLSQSNTERLQAVQRMLLRMGISSRIYQNRRVAGKSYLPDGKGGNAWYDTKASHELVISGEDLFYYEERIGFSHDSKRLKLKTLLSEYKRKPNKTKFLATVSSITGLGEEPVYDITVAEVHAFDANGLYAHNCVEQQLEDAELCCLVETFPAKHDDYEDYLKTLKIAYMYGKTVTLVNTHWPETNGIMLKNRRIGLSQSGVVQAFNKHGRRELYNWCDNAYEEVRKLDKGYSDWLCVPRSVRTTSIKPSGTVSLLNGSTPGIHFPESEFYIRRIRFSADSDLLKTIGEHGFKIEDDEYSPNTKVVEFPIHEPFFEKGKKDVSIWEQLEIAAQYQHYWADNSVSITCTFQPEEAKDIKSALEMYETRLKAVSFLKYKETGYVQAPYEPITREQYKEMIKDVIPIQRIKTNNAGNGTKFCDGDYCEL